MNYPTEEMMRTGLGHYDLDPGHYHCAEHALKMMSALDYVFNEEDDRDDVMIGPPSWSRKDRMLLKTAALFHDASYIPGCGENEENAAEIAVREARLRGWTPADCDDLKLLILSTQPFQLDRFVETRPDLEQHMYLLHDLDWLGFSDYEIMVENETRIITEAWSREELHLTYDDVLEKQLEFYKKILELAKDQESVIGKGFYRYWKYRHMNKQTLENISYRVDEIELDKKLDRLPRNSSPAS